MKRMGGDPNKINPLVPVDLVIDHSVQVDQFASSSALDFNVQKEFERNASHVTSIGCRMACQHDPVGEC